MNYYPLLQESQKYNTLSDEDFTLLYNLMKAGSELARLQLYKYNLKLIFFTITKYRFDQGPREVTEDLVMELASQLWHILPKYDRKKSRKFSTFAVFCLKNKAITFLEKEGTYKKKFVMASDAIWDTGFLYRHMESKL